MENINISHIIRLIIDNKRRFVINGIIVFVIACAYILCIPRSYRASINLAPETEVSSGLNTLSNIASTFGFDINAGQSSDAISPELYPDLFKSNDFLVKLLGIQVYSEKAGREVDYFTYLSQYQDHAPWEPIVQKIKRLFKRPKKRITIPATNDGAQEETGINPFYLTEQEYFAVEALKSNIKCSTDKKTGVISIVVEDQSPYVCACMADSARVYLQKFITDYRTNKARIDVDYYKLLCEQAEKEYKQALNEYSVYTDSHSGNLRQSYQAKTDELENNVQARLSTLVSIRQQLITAEAKVQEKTPAFTILQGASVPNKASGPKRMIFVAFMLLLSCIGTFLWLVRNKFKESLGLSTFERTYTRMDG